jgi:hypothetical protein
MAAKTQYAENPETGERWALVNKQWVPAPKKSEPAPVDQRTFNTAQATLEDLQKMEPRAGFWTTGMVGSTLKRLPGTPAYDLDRDIDTVKSRVAMNALGALKAQSSTGASGFGALSAPELNVIQSELGSLDTGQSKNQFLKNLDRVGELTAKSVMGASPENPFDLSEGQSRSSIPKGAYYRDPQGNVRRNMNYDAGNPIVSQPNAFAPKAAAPGRAQPAAKRPALDDIFKD